MMVTSVVLGRVKSDAAGGFICGEGSRQESPCLRLPNGLALGRERMGRMERESEKALPAFVRNQTILGRTFLDGNLSVSLPSISLLISFCLYIVSLSLF